MDEFRFLAEYGAVGLLAGILFYFYRKDVRMYTELWRGQSELLLSVVRENTAAFQAFKTLMEEMSGRRIEDRQKERDKLVK